MSYRKIAVVGFILLSALTVLLAGAKPGVGTAAVRSGERPGAPPYGLRGPHPVGIRDLALDDETPLEMNMWYPALPDDNPGGTTEYPYEIKLGAPLGAVTIAASAGQAVREGPFDLAQGPYPLVVLSPGFAIGSTSYAWLAEHLASYGFVVISPEHREHLDPENELWRAAITRPQDILALFAYVDEAVGPGGALEGLIDPETVAVIGHSYGGYTTLAAAGAQIDTASFEAHCEDAARADDPAVWLCEMLLPRLAEMAGLAGLASFPEGLWPAWSDPRVDAIVPMAGDAFFFGQPGLAKIDVPLMAIGGTLDGDTPFAWGPGPTYEYASSPARVLVALNDAEHLIFANTCEAIRWYAKVVAGEFCADSVWDRDRAHDLINHLTAAFLLAELKQDTDAAAALAPDAAEFPGVSYQAQGF